MSFDSYSVPTDSVDVDATSFNGVLRTEFIDFTEWHFDSRDNPEILLTPDQFQAKKDPGKYEDYALLLRRKRQWRKGAEYLHISTWLEVRDEILQNALRRVLAPIRYLDLNSTPLIIHQPFRELFWFREEIGQYKERNCKDGDEEKSYGLLLDFMAKHLDQPIRMYDRVVSMKTVEYKHLWMAFRPGSLAISVENGLLQAFLIRSFRNAVEVIPKQPAAIMCSVWSCDSDDFGPSGISVTLEEFSGSRNILELPVYPFAFLPEPDQEILLQRLVQKGRKWKSLINVCHKQYKGIGLELSRRESGQTRMDHRYDSPSSEIGTYHGTQRQVNGRIVLDHTTAMECNPGSEQPLLTGLKLASPHSEILEDHVPSLKALDFSALYRKHKRDSTYSMSNEEALLCPSTVRGYSLKDKCWIDFNVEIVKDIEWDETCLPKLQIDSATRDFLACLVSKHANAGHQMKDVINEKGKGLTFLFHGPPGCGKSLTAEVLAEHTKMPLLRITSGDLGTKAGEAERKIQEAFRLASAWKAIILLDEADVFLAKRKTGDIGRNAFVTIFLTSMEYYAGTLMLTTNQPDAFDEAFQSRIHLQIAYPPLNGEQRKAIWRNVVEDQSIEHDLDEAAFARLGERFVRNGRDIKNLIQLAFLSAQSGGLRLNEEIITKICSMDCRHIPQ